MDVQGRRNKIVELVTQHGEMTVRELVDRFDASHETIRRDLGLLADLGRIQKIHGGARRARLHVEGPLQERMLQETGAKHQIAKKLCRIVEPGQTLFIDTGSTTQACAEELAKIAGLTVITNSVRVAEIMAAGSGGSSVYLLGGRFVGRNAQTAGALSCNQIALFHADMAILTVAALDAAQGASDADVNEATVAREMMARAARTVIVADTTKFARTAAFRVCGLKEISVLVSNGQPTDTLSAALREAGVTLL